MKLTYDQKVALVALAIDYPVPVVDVNASTCHSSLIRKGLATKVPAAGRNSRGQAYASYSLTANGVDALRDVHPRQWERVDQIVAAKAGGEK